MAMMMMLIVFVNALLLQIGSLVIEATKKQDSGNYTCSPSNSPSSTVTLHVINSKYNFRNFKHKVEHLFRFLGGI